MTKKLHLAIIMDGNGRWAKNQQLSRLAGHKAGAQALYDLLTILPNEIGIITVYAFSLENWARSVLEVYHLMKLTYEFLNQHLKLFVEKGIRVNFIGNTSLLPSYIINLFEKVKTETAQGDKLYFNIAISYGSRQEILQAAKQFNLEADEQMINQEQAFEQFLSTGGMPDPDILIRTGGEKRLSNYLLWQLAYTELFFIDKLWPDFNLYDLQLILNEYFMRNRRFGYV